MEDVSTLENGMIQDNGPELQPKNSYNYGRNGNLISKGNNNYSFEAIDGTKLSWSMPLHKTGEGKFIPIGWYRMGEDLVVFSTDEKSINGGDGEIGLVTFDNAGKGTYSAKYYHPSLLFTQSQMIEGYGIEENDAYHRAYWTDNLNQPRTINLASPIITTEYLTTQLVVGVQYMVLTDSIGSITHNAIVYGPKQAAGNVFTAVNTVFVTTGSAKVIRYLNPNILNYTPEKALSTIDFVEYIGGNVNCGVKMYAYRLSTFDGYQSSWSFTTNPIHVGPSSPGLGYQQYQGGGSSGLTNSGKGLELLITNIPLEFDKIQVAVIEVDGTYDVIRNSEIFWDTTISGASMTINHIGQENLGAFLVDDLILKTAIIARIKTMTTIKQRQEIANLTERQEIEFDPTAATITPFVYEVPADANALTTREFNTPICAAAGIASGSIFPKGHYVVRGTGSITYNAVVYAVGITFIGVAGVTTFTVTSGVPIVRGCIRIQQYLKFSSAPVYKIIDLLDEYFDYKSMASHMYLKGHWRDETYRLAAVPIDKFGNPFFGRFMGDVTIPSQSDVSGTYKLLNSYATDTKFTLGIVGLTISNLDITDIADQVGGIQIMRVPRDAQVLGQGCLWQNCDSYNHNATLNPNTIVPLSTANTADDFNANPSVGVNGMQPYRFGVMGPEFDFNLSQFNIGVVSADRLKPVADYSPLLSGGDAMRSDGLAEQRYSKWYLHNRYTGLDSAISRADNSSVGTTTTLGGGYILKNEDIATDTSTAFGRKCARGGQRTIITVDAVDFYNPANGGLGTGTNGDTNRRLIVNYVRPKTNLYGGTSDVAKANNLYIPTGHFLRIDSTVLADIDDGAGNYVLNGMQVFGGDCFVNLYDRMTSVYDEKYSSGGNPISNGDGSYSYGYVFPVESNINTGLREGRHMSKDGMHNNPNGVVYNFGGTRRDESFTYNPAYSSENDQRVYAPLPVDFVDTGRFPFTARYSQQKNLGETIDNMRIFLVNNFKNADALHGEINNLIVGLDRLFYLQNKGVGYFPIEERESTTGALGQAVQLGVGGVMQRADQLDKFYGNQHQWGVITLENNFMFFDMRRRTPVRMSYDGQVMDMAVIKGMQGFFQNAFTDVEVEANTGGTILSLDKPLLGNGIIAVYDTKHKCAYMTFKFNKNEARAVEDFNRPKDFTIGVSSQLDKFTGFFDFTPGIIIEHNNYVYAAQESRFDIIADMPYIKGMIVSKDQSNYLCIKDLTTSDPVAANQQPDYGGSIYWVKINSENEIDQYWKGDICKLHGVVYPYELAVVQNQNLDIEKIYDNHEIYGNDVLPTDLYYETSRQTGSDLDIASSNKNIRLIDNSVWANIAFDTNRSRMLDHWLKTRIVVKNYSTDQTVSLNKKKRIVYLKTIYRKVL